MNELEKMLRYRAERDELLAALEPFAHFQVYRIEETDLHRAREVYERLAPPHEHPAGSFNKRERPAASSVPLFDEPAMAVDGMLYCPNISCEVRLVALEDADHYSGSGAFHCPSCGTVLVTPSAGMYKQ